MASVTTTARAPADASAGQGAGTIRPRRSLPGSRAVTGALLVTVAAVALFASYSKATSPTRHTYLVASRDIRAGETLGAKDVRLAPMDLPLGTTERAFTSIDQLRGRVALGPIHAGELLDRSTVPADSPTGHRAQVSLSLEVDRTVNGSLRPGDKVDVLVTYGTGAGSTTHVVASRATLLEAPTAGEAGLGGNRLQTLTLEITNLDDAMHVVNARRAGEVTLVRTTGFEGRDYSASTYSPSSTPASSTQKSAAATAPASGTGG